VIYNRWGKEVYKKQNYQNDWTAKDLPTGTYYYHLTHANNCFKPVNGWMQVLR
ncbi:MAG: gliding motility-associated C-terminal domain-containing protein, partial [Verrucomicrobia bacterium]|nr:gliding motility-associated C-terminal domain-containing protein [Cytophagales bacterium]